MPGRLRPYTTRKKEACLQLIRQDPHTLLAYTTISKEGIRIICPYICHPDFYFRNETELYKLAFEKINRHYAALIGHEYDEKCKNITRLSGLAHDPEAWYCENALPFEIEAPASLLDETKSRKKQERLQKVVDAIRTHLADKGVEYTDHQRNNYIMRTGYLFNAYGVDQQTATAWGVKQFADYDGDVAGIFRSCYRKTDEYGTLKLPSHSGKKSSPNDAATSVVSDIEAFLSTQGRFRKNTITRKCEMAETGSDKFSDLTDRMVNTLWCRMS
ncbi:MAG TPA: virulence protein E, partial [Candidatus Bacteroides avicola]|nr:virulence protein E [Candidatus Bacteroides avicola]